MPPPRGQLAVSLLYDTLLFAAMVSLSAVLLIPALVSPLSSDASIEKHRELQVDDVLHTLLVSRPDSFSYTFCGSLLDAAAGRLGVDTTSPGLYTAVRLWILDNEPHHESYEALIAEDLVSQLRIPDGSDGSVRLNLLTTDFDDALRDALHQFFTPLFQGRYAYNVSAQWHPITGLRFGGELFLGPPPPPLTSHVATQQISVPLTPAVRIGNTTIILSQYALARYFTALNLTGNRSIPEVASIRMVLSDYQHQTPPYDSRPFAEAAVVRNLSHLLDGFLIDGIHDTSNATVFPGIANATLDALLARLNNAAQQKNTTLYESVGDLVRAVDHTLSELNASTTTPLASLMLGHFNQTLDSLLNTTFPSLPEAIAACKDWVLNQTTTTVHILFRPMLEAFVTDLFDAGDCVLAFQTMLGSWLLDRLAIQSAYVTLTIWPVHP